MHAFPVRAAERETERERDRGGERGGGRAIRLAFIALPTMPIPGWNLNYIPRAKLRAHYRRVVLISIIFPGLLSIRGAGEDRP